MSTSQITVAIFSLIAVFSAAYADGAQLGGFKPIKNLNDPYIQDIAKFAVEEYNKRSPNGHRLRLVNVVKGESQVVAGTNYRLTIAANDDHQYLAVVYDRPWQHYRSLTSFNAVSV
ncbi:Cysteine proteinase inhibitor 5 [Bienertia sinuspersici]